MKIVKKKNQLKIVIFTAVKNRCMLHGHVFVMKRIVRSARAFSQSDQSSLFASLRKHAHVVYCNFSRLLKGKFSDEKF